MLAPLADSGNTPAEVEVHQLQRCTHCKAPVYWMREHYTGRWAAVDVGITRTENVLINLTAGTYEVLSDRNAAPYRDWTHALHRNICPDAKQQGMW